jgi:TonB-linked SusC/RagA family outer membrane protein
MRKFVLFIAAVLGVAMVHAQNKQVSGMVYAPDGTVVAGATVLVEGTTTVTLSSVDGHYVINAPQNGTLVFSLLGYQTQSVAIEGRSVVDVNMKEDTEVIDDVVVLAYGSTSARKATASVASIKADALKDSPSVSLDQMMQGRASGVSITTPNAGVGQAANVMVRGVSSISAGTNPLYVVDGVPIMAGNMSPSGVADANGLADINPADIVSIDVLKDAAATALYGSRAASGVVIITTKQGRTGKAKVTYDMSIGASNATYLPEVMDAKQYTEFKNMSLVNRIGTSEVSLNGKESDWGKNAFNLMTDSKGNLINTNWADELFRTGIIQNHTLAVSGGSNRVSYYMSANHTDQNGIVVGDKYQRLGIRANVSGQATDWLKVGFTANYTHSKTEMQDGSRGGEVYAAVGYTRAALILPPNTPAYNEDGTYYVDGTKQYLGDGPNRVSTSYQNPVTTLDNINQSTIDRMISSGFVEITPISGLSVKSQFGVDYSKNEEAKFWTPNYGQGVTYPGYSYNVFTDYMNWNWTNTIGYTVDIKDHNIDILLGQEMTSEGYDYAILSGTGILNKDFSGLYPGYEEYDGGAARGKRTMSSFFGRFNYDYKSKYLISLNYRRDGLSSLGANSKWGNFWGVSGAWRISEEGFWDDIRSTMNEFKLKASYGTVGNSEIGYYNAQSYFGSSLYGKDYALLLGNIGDDNLQWETSNKFDIGFSMQFLNNITVDFDYYNTKTSSLVFAVPQGPSTGIGSLVTNAGAMRNSGIELAIGADVIKRKNFVWSTNFNFTYAKNEVVELANGVTEIYGESECNITIPGYSVGQLYVYPTGGIDSETGQRIFYGPNGEWTRLDMSTGSPTWYLKDGTAYKGGFERVRAGNTLPTYFGGWTNTFRFYGFDVTLFLQYSGGNWIYNGTGASLSDFRWWNNSMDVYENYWKEPGDNAKYPKPYYGDNYSNGSAMEITDWVERGDYLRVKNICLGYTFNTKKWNQKLGISSLRLYVQCQNALTLTGYSGLDPETNSMTGDMILSGGFDKNTLPQARTWTGGLNITF